MLTTQTIEVEGAAGVRRVEVRPITYRDRTRLFSRFGVVTQGIPPLPPAERVGEWEATPEQRVVWADATHALSEGCIAACVMSIDDTPCAGLAAVDAAAGADWQAIAIAVMRHAMSDTDPAKKT